MGAAVPEKPVESSAPAEPEIKEAVQEPVEVAVVEKPVETAPPAETAPSVESPAPSETPEESSVAQEKEEIQESIPEPVSTKTTAPAAPVNLTVLEATESFVTITWETPSSDGGSPITKYSISMRSQDKNKYKEVAQVDATTTEYKITDMKKKKEYFIKVEALNEVGVSEAAEIGEPVMLKK